MSEPIACGLCFPWALNEVIRHGGTLVHAVVTAPLSRPPHRYEHAWVERDGRAYDWQTMVAGHGGPRFARKGYPVETFYELYTPEHVFEYSPLEAAEASLVEGHDGPWEPSVARNAAAYEYDIELVEVDTGGKHSFRFELRGVGPRVPLYAETVGMIEAFRARRNGRVVYIVRNVSVEPELQRSGWGTVLYRAAAAEACRRRSSLASQGPRTQSSQGFWDKQVSRDRATHLGTLQRGPPDRSTYALRRELCPEPVLGNPTPGLEIEARRDNPMFDLLLVARDDRGELVGSLGLVELGHDDLYGVVYGHVVKERRREGIYAALIACAAEAACEEGMRVASDTSLSWDADAFWSSERGGGGKREIFDGRTRYVVPCEEE